jgi:hypothetical protein
MTLDLSLPPRAPELARWDDCVWDDAAFAVYSLLGDKISIQDVASALEKQWLEEGNEEHLTRPAPPALGLKTTLRDLVKAHIDLDKVDHNRSGGNTKKELKWWPTAFIVVVREDWTKPGGLLFVFADDENDYVVDKYFFKLEDAYMMLASLQYMDEGYATSKEFYAQDAI